MKAGAEKIGMGGNIYGQVKEAERSMSIHRERVLKAKPNKEIQNSLTPVQRFIIQDGKRRLLLKKREEDNKKLMARIVEIMTEPRQPGSREFAPGYRMNHAMIPVIDCYPPEKANKHMFEVPNST